jgi:sigma-B regulation protein RsbU (phosphoserine phosphatase)
MDTGILESVITLFQMICVIMVFAYLFTRSRYFREVFEHRATLSTSIILVLFFGLLSVYGSISKINLYGAVLNVHDLGPVIAGMACGPYVGLGAGIIGGAFRFTQGGPYMYAAALATILAGVLGGLIYLANKKEFITTTHAVIYTFLIEILLSIMQIAMVTPAAQVANVATFVALPMIIIVTVAVFIFSKIIHNLLDERRMQQEKEKLESEMARKDAELQIAAEIQQSFMPDVIPQITGFDIAARTVMAKEVGGDFFDVIPFEVIALDKGTLGLMIADVSGKGVPAALFMALSRIVVRVNALWHRDPAKAIFASNNIITPDSKSGMFVTLFYGALSEKDRTLTYVNAGHNSPIVCRSRDGSIEELMPTGIVLGAVENREYFSRTIDICPGDVIVLYTDGVTEPVNEQEEMFGEERLTSIIRENARLPASEIVAKILREVQQFTEGMPQFDDITLMVIKGT